MKYQSFIAFFAANPELCHHKAQGEFEVKNGFCPLCQRRIKQATEIPGLYGHEELLALKVINKQL